MADVGETLPFRSNLFNLPEELGGAPSNAVTATLTIALPDGTTATPTVANPPAVLGQYAVDYTPTMAGRHVGTWVFAMAGGQVTSFVETFDVGASLVTVDEAISHLRAAGVVTSYADLEQLQWLCLVASEAVERDLGRAVIRRTVTEIHDGSRVLVLGSTPVASITALTVDGTAVVAADYAVDLTAGVLYSAGGSFGYGRQVVSVTYVAGYTDPPRIIRKVALNAVQGMWQASQQAPHPLLDEQVDVFAAQGALSPVEQRAYDSYRAAAVA